MGRFDRYMLQQLLMLFGFFSLVLTLVFWVNRAVGMLEWLLGDGQSIKTFLQLSMLIIPSVIVNMLPIAGFAAAVYATNKLASESELVVVQAAGYSPARTSRAVIVFGLLVTLTVGILAHVIEPLARHETNTQRDMITQDITARLLTEGTFVHPTKGITFYVREITPAGELLDIYLSISRTDQMNQSFFASRALIVQENDGPMLLMFNGSAQDLSDEGQRLSVTKFDSFAYGLGDWIGAADPADQKVSTLTSAQLITASPSLIENLGTTKSKLINEIHSRNNRALMGVVAALLGFSSLIVGGFSRFGLWRQIFLGLVLMVIIKSFDNSVGGIVRRTPDLWPLYYIVNVIGILISAALLWKAARPGLRMPWSAVASTSSATDSPFKKAGKN